MRINAVSERRILLHLQHFCVHRVDKMLVVDESVFNVPLNAFEISSLKSFRWFSNDDTKLSSSSSLPSSTKTEKGVSLGGSKWNEPLISSNGIFTERDKECFWYFSLGLKSKNHARSSSSSSSREEEESVSDIRERSISSNKSVCVSTLFRMR